MAIVSYAGVMQGSQSMVAIGEESSWGTALKGGQSSRYKFLRTVKGGDGLEHEESTLKATAVGLLGYAYEHVNKGSINPHGPLTFEVPYEGAERLFYHTMGAKNGPTKDGTYDFYNTSFQISDLLPGGGLTLHVRRGIDTGGLGTTFSYTGMRPMSMELACQVNGYLRGTWDFFGKDTLLAANDSANGWGTGTQYQNPPSTAGFYFGGMQLYYSTAAASASSASVVQAEDFLFRYTNSLDVDRYPCGTRYRLEPIRGGKVEATAEFTLDFDSPDQYNDFRSAALKSFRCDFWGEPMTGGAFNNQPFFMRILGGSERGYLLNAPIKVDDEGRIKAKYRMQFFRNAAESAGEFIITIINRLTAI